MTRGTLVALSICITLVHSPASAEVKVKYRGAQAVAIAHLADKKTCDSTTRSTVVGRIVKREFGSDGVRLQNFVFEEEDGSRGVINVDFDEIEKNEGMAGISTALPAVQQLTKIGRKFRADVFLCGAAGRVMILENLS